MRVLLNLVTAAALLGALTACDLLDSPAGTPTATGSIDPVADMTVEQQVGQLFMIGTPADHLTDTAAAALTDRYVGGIFLSGRSGFGADKTAILTDRIRQASASEIPLLIATDQEGGQVQVLSGHGFSEIPSALDQGAMSPVELRTAARQWGSELARAGVNLDLAPVADIVRSENADNAPIAAFDREYGFTAAEVEPHASAFIAGMTAAGVQTAVKHFPGLGYVVDNTDTTAGVTDTVTAPDGPTVASFTSIIDQGAPLVMVSSAIYQRMDPKAPAVFSHAVVTDLLREKVGFDGIIMSDDLSAATQVTKWKPGRRAILAIRAGVDLVLVSRMPEVAAEMMDAVVAQAKSDPAFAACVTAAARLVVAQKLALGIQ